MLATFIGKCRTCGHDHGDGIIGNDSSAWIDVKDRLPEIKDDGFSDHVLVSIVGGSMFVAWRDIEDADGWGCDQLLPEPPTHWMVLPEPPNAD